LPIRIPRWIRLMLAIVDDMSRRGFVQPGGERSNRASVIAVRVTGLMLALVACICLAAQPAAGDEVHVPPASQPASGNASSVRFVLTGTRVVKCDSRWHKVELTFKAAGRLVLTGQVAADLLPPQDPDGPWDVPARAANAIASGLREHMTVSCDDRAAAAKWLGGQVTEEQSESLGRLSGRLVAEADVAADQRLVALSGTLRIEHSRTLAGRYGPNWQQATWQLRLAGKLRVDAGSGRVVAGELTVDGVIEGRYFTKGGGPHLVEPYTETVKLRLTVVPPPTPQTLKRVAALIRQMGDDSYKRREQATDALRKMGDAATDQLRAAASDSDPEIAVRARMLLRELDPQPRRKQDRSPARLELPLLP